MIDRYFGPELFGPGGYGRAAASGVESKELVRTVRVLRSEAVRSEI